MAVTNKENMEFCISCGCYSEYEIRSERIQYEIRGIQFTYTEESAYCTGCGEPIYVPEVNDRNVRARENAYRKAAGLISVEEIQEVMNRYNIGAEPLALVLGFGKITITHYMGGKLPSKANSDRLFEVKKSFRLMKSLLEENKELITDTAYQKCAGALDRLEVLYSCDKIKVVTRYLLRKACDITPLALQKLLYYAQAFYQALFGTELFYDSCYAWVHGPVYPQVYRKYKAYGFDPIDTPELDMEDDLSYLSSSEIELLDSIVATFGCYSSRILERMTHQEEPWQKARVGLGPNERGHVMVSKQDIGQYFQEICKEHKITNAGEIKNYSDFALNSVLRH